MLHLWVTSKVLSSEKGLMDDLHGCFWKSIESAGASREFLRDLQKKLFDRYGRYYRAWDESPKEPLLPLSQEILKCVLNDGEPHQALLNAAWQTDVVTKVMTFMMLVRKLQSDCEIVASEKGSNSP